MNQNENDDKIKQTTAVEASLTNSLSNSQDTPTGDVFVLTNALKDLSSWRKLLADDDFVNFTNIENIFNKYNGNISAAKNVNDVTTLDKSTAVDFLIKDYKMRFYIERCYNIMSKTFMFDHNDKIKSYNLPRALAYVSKRLSDEIEELEEYVNEGITDKKDMFKESNYVESSSLTSTGDSDWKKRAEKARMEKALKQVSKFNIEDKETRDRLIKELSAYGREYLPGELTDSVFGIDLETTGLNPLRVYVIDCGYMNMNVSPTSNGRTNLNVTEDNNLFIKDYNNIEDAYNVGRQMFGVPEKRMKLGNKVAFVTGIETDMLTGKIPFDEDITAQRNLLKKLEEVPYVAHNAHFEHSFFMANVDGYAEAYRNGKITIIDTMYMSKIWDKKSTDEDHGSNSLNDYAKRWEAISKDDNERHLGLEDTFIMLEAMKNHLNYLDTIQEGPWSMYAPIMDEGGKTIKCNK